jgi:hypothetical protein
MILAIAILLTCLLAFMLFIQYLAINDAEKEYEELEEENVRLARVVKDLEIEIQNGRIRPVTHSHLFSSLKNWREKNE